VKADELAQSIRSKHDKLESDCKQTVLAVELLALQMKVEILEKQLQQLVCCLQSIAKCIVVPDVFKITEIKRQEHK
jgi:hypothetical protein